MSGVPPKFPMIWTLFKPNIFFAPFTSLYTTHQPVGIHGSPRAFRAARLLRLALRAERPRAKNRSGGLCRFGGDRLFGFFVALRLTGRRLDRHPERRHPGLKHIQAGLQFGMIDPLDHFVERSLNTFQDRHDESWIERHRVLLSPD